MDIQEVPHSWKKPQKVEALDKKHWNLAELE